MWTAKAEARSQSDRRSAAAASSAAAHSAASSMNSFSFRWFRQMKLRSSSLPFWWEYAMTAAGVRKSLAIANAMKSSLVKRAAFRLTF